MEEEIKELKRKNEKLEEANKLLKESINNRETKFKNKLLKLIVLVLLGWGVFLENANWYRNWQNRKKHIKGMHEATD
jgi:hypothetical protein